MLCPHLSLQLQLLPREQKLILPPQQVQHTTFPLLPQINPCTLRFQLFALASAAILSSCSPPVFDHSTPKD